MPSEEQAMPASVFAEFALDGGTVWEDLVADHQVHDLTPAEVSKGIAEGRYLLVDVREPNEVAVEAYPDAVVVPLSTFDPQDIPDPEGKQVVFACRSGKRSVTASLAAQADGLGLRQASGRRHAGLEGCGPADQDRLTVP